MKFFWDTNIAIYYLQRSLSDSSEAFIDGILQSNPPIISAITEIELLCWKTPNEKEVQVLRDFINDSTTIELELPIKLKTAEVRKNTSIKLPDAIIAATALVYDLTLLSRNVSDFENVEGLKLINPWDV